MILAKLPKGGKSGVFFNTTKLLGIFYVFSLLQVRAQECANFEIKSALKNSYCLLRHTFCEKIIGKMSGCFFHYFASNNLKLLFKGREFLVAISFIMQSVWADFFMVLGLSSRKKQLAFSNILMILYVFRSWQLKGENLKKIHTPKKLNRRENFSYRLLKTPLDFDSLFFDFRHLSYQLQCMGVSDF